MSKSDANFNLIDTKLNGLRRQWSRFIFLNGIIRALILVLFVGFIIATIEGFRYFQAPVRLSILRFTMGFLIIFFLTPIILATLVRVNRMIAYSNMNLAKKIGKQFSGIGDRLVNGLQLYKMTLEKKSGYSLELADYSVKTVADDIQKYRFAEIIPWKKLRASFIQLLIISLVTSGLVLLNSSFYGASANRLFHPHESFDIPVPFEITSLSGSFGVFGGDTVIVAFQCSGEIPEQINFRAVYPDYLKDERFTPDETGRVEINLGAVRSTIIYEAFVENRSIFKPWKRISSGTDTIRVTDRPEILAVKIRIDPLAYTQLSSDVQESNNLELMLIPGSELTLTLISNKTLKSANLHLRSGKKIRFIVQNKTAAGQFTVFDADEFYFKVFDENDVSNTNPMMYKIRLIPDSYPVCQLISPDSDIELTEAMEIPLGIRISDDFGFSKALIRYRVIKQFIPDMSIVDSLEFPIQNLKLSLQELYYSWSVSDLQLSPEDVVEFQVIVFDNDPVNGPKSASSKTLKARFPSLNDLFSDFYEQQDDIAEQGDEILRELENASDVLEEISLELLKNPELSWEQKNQLMKEIEKTEKAGKKLSKMADQLNDMMQESRENELFDEETLKKYSQLQQSFQEIMTPELREAMQKLQQALEKMDQQEVREALNQFRINREQFSEEIDRMLKLLERVKIEQSVDEIVRRLEDLTERQEQITNEIEQTPESEQGKLDQIAGEEKTVERDTEVLFDVIERTSNDMKEFPLMPSEELKSRLEEFENSDVMEQMSQTRKSLKNGDKNQAGSKSKSVQQQMQDFLDKMQQFQANFNADQMNQLMSDFRKVIYKTMQVSQSQEQLGQMIKDTPRQSDQLMDVAVKQQQIRQNLSSVIGDLIELSNKTFGLSPQVGKGFGQAAAAMSNAIQQMEERNPSAASNSANQATAAINMTALNLINSMNELQQSGSSSGFEKYMEQLQKMAGQQQGINDETQMLGMGQNGQQQALQRLAARQQQLRKSLENLQNELAESSDQGGDLGGIAKDMDDVIKDLQQNRVLRKTLERQQRILSRLLDAQKSLRTQDFKKERKSVTGADIYRKSPGELPTDLGERRTVLRENLEQALKEGYSREYEELIRQYFQLISTEENDKQK
ncbi:hypothetical protein KJ762_01520 [bacterium]|nr:hypothetical protein [bacterium]MBU1633168.1 hypothetical protein [bacterium]MBU1874842.1 hypothetical protein [bacterium]